MGKANSALNFLESYMERRLAIKGREDFKNIYIAGAREFSINSIGKREKRVVLIYVPYPSLKSAQKIMAKLVNTIHKKKQVQAFITAKRTILSRWHKVHHSQKRPRSRTLTSVFDSILDDLLVPGNITARRIRHKMNGKLLYKIWVNEENRTYLEERTDAIQEIYKHLTRRAVDIDFKNEPKYYKYKNYNK